MLWVLDLQLWPGSLVSCLLGSSKDGHTNLEANMQVCRLAAYQHYKGFIALAVPLISMASVVRVQWYRIYLFTVQKGNPLFKVLAL